MGQYDKVLFNKKIVLQGTLHVICALECTSLHVITHNYFSIFDRQQIFLATCSFVEEIQSF